TTTSSTIAGICSIVTRTPSSSLWHGMTTEMRLPRNMRTPLECPRSGVRRGGGRGAAGAGAAGRQAGARRLLPGQFPPRLAELQHRRLLHDRRHHAGIEEDVDGEEALVGAEALRLANEATRLLGGLAEPDLLEVVPRLAHVAELAVDQQLARVDVAVGEHRAAEVPGVAGNLVLVLARDLRDQVVAHDALRV